jgi:hypothetical protein
MTIAKKAMLCRLIGEIRYLESRTNDDDLSDNQFNEAMARLVGLRTLVSEIEDNADYM